MGGLHLWEAEQEWACDQLTNSSLEFDRAHHANLEAEIAQRATQVALDVERLGLQRLVSNMRRFWLAIAALLGRIP
jgi:hypothetical protein